MSEARRKDHTVHYGQDVREAMTAPARHMRDHLNTTTAHMLGAAPHMVPSDDNPGTSPRQREKTAVQDRVNGDKRRKPPRRASRAVAAAFGGATLMSGAAIARIADPDS